MSATPTPSQGEFQVLTSPGPAAIAVIRAHGEGIGAFVEKYVRAASKRGDRAWATGTVLRAVLQDGAGGPIDDILISVHADPPEWGIRLHLHGSPWVVRRCAELLREFGLVERRVDHTALWPTTDTLEAEAYALLPKMSTTRGARWLCTRPAALRAAIQTILGLGSAAAARQMCRELIARADVFDWFAAPLRVALIGPPNSGKSTLANALADETVSLVAPTPGTTRDWIEVPGEVAGFPVVWLDTAGLRTESDAVEAAGIAHTRRQMNAADAVVVVLDITEPPAARAAFLGQYSAICPACVALNKSDLAANAEVPVVDLPTPWQMRAVEISAAERRGLDALGHGLLAGIGRDEAMTDKPCAFAPRQVQCLEAAAREANLDRIRHSLANCLQEPPPLY